MATIVTINASDQITNSRADINTNFANLNSDKIETSAIDTDTTLAANSDSKIASQKAIKAYVDGNAGKVFAAGIVTPTTSPTTIAHGLGSSPTYVRITGISVTGSNDTQEYFSMAVYVSSTQYSMSKFINDQVSGSGSAAITSTLKLDGCTGTITVDSTNITITWSGTISATARIIWEAFK